MKPIFKVKVSSSSELPDEPQQILTLLNKIGTRFNIEEYCNDCITAYVTIDGIYLFTTKESSAKNSNATGQFITYTLIKVENIKELYEKVMVQRTYLELREVKTILNNIEISVKQMVIIR